MDEAYTLQGKGATEVNGILAMFTAALLTAKDTNREIHAIGIPITKSAEFWKFVTAHKAAAINDDTERMEFKVHIFGTDVIAFATNDKEYSVEYAP